MNEPFDVLHPGGVLIEPSAAPPGARSETPGSPSGVPMGTATSPAGMERIDPRVKIVAILCASALAVTFDRLASLAALTGLCAAVVVAARLPREQLRPLATVIALATWGAVFSQALFYDSLPRTPLWTLIPAGKIGGLEFPGLYVYREGMRHGLVQSLRFDALILLGTSVCLTTSPERLFLGLTRLRVPFGLSFMAVTAVRFLPLVLAELRTVMAVRRLRGYRPLRRGLRTTLRVEAGTLKPVVVKVLRRATDLATSLSLRAFDPAGERSSYRALTLSRGERAGLVALVGSTVALVMLKGLFLLYLHEVLYLPGLRPVYGWIRAWL